MMNSATLASVMLSRILDIVRTRPSAATIRDPDHMWREITKAIAEEVVSHIQTNAKCSGMDSHSDTHDSVGIV
jgi:hypothetical protein